MFGLIIIPCVFKQAAQNANKSRWNLKTIINIADSRCPFQSEKAYLLQQYLWLTSSFVSISWLHVSLFLICTYGLYGKAKQSTIRYRLNSLTCSAKGSQVHLKSITFLWLIFFCAPSKKDDLSRAFIELKHIWGVCVCNPHSALQWPLHMRLLNVFFWSFNSKLLEQNNCHFPASGSKVIQHNEMSKKEKGRWLGWRRWGGGGDSADRQHAKSNTVPSE